MSTLRRKIGQLFMLGFPGTEPPESLRRLMRDRELGGVIVFTRNGSDAASMGRLIEQVREASPTPLLVAIDHEGGPVLRLDSGVSQLPSAMALAASGDPERAAAAGAIAGAELAALGVDINLAPVLDVQSNPDNPGIGLRSFGDTPAQVARFALPYLQALQAAGLSATAKHFPGKGSASLDAHFDLPYIGRDLETLRRIDFPPFVAAVRAGVDCFMGSHTVYEAFGDDVPGTLSRRLMTGLLREEMGFRGVLITDDLEMGAIRDHFGFERAIKSSFLAGADLLLICHTLERQEEAMAVIEAAVASGEIPESRIDESVERVAALKAKHLARRTAGPAASLPALVDANRETVSRMWRESVCLVQDPSGHIPLRAGRSALVLAPVLAQLSPVEERSGTGATPLGELLDALPGAVKETFVPKRPSSTEALCARARECDVTLFFSYNAHVDPDQALLLEQVRDASRAFVLVALRNPYDARMVRPADAAIATLGFRPDVLSVAVRVLLGREAPAGKLPVGLRGPGEGLG